MIFNEMRLISAVKKILNNEYLIITFGMHYYLSNIIHVRVMVVSNKFFYTYIVE